MLELDAAPASGLERLAALAQLGLVMLGLFAIAFVRLGMLGMSEGTAAQTIEMRVCTFVYFGFFVLLYFISPGAKTKPVPERLTH